MFSESSISRRETLKILFYSSLFVTLPGITSCNNDITESSAKEFTAPIDAQIAGIKSLAVKKSDDGGFKVPASFVYRPLDGSCFVLLVHKKANGSFTLNFKKASIKEHLGTTFLLGGLQEDMVLLNEPAATLNKLNRIDHRGLKERFLNNKGDE